VGLVLQRIEAKDFRSYESLVLEPDPRITVLVGPNASGKTNAMEAIQVLCSGASFRRPAWADVVRWGSERASLSMLAEGDGRRVETAMTVDTQGRRSYEVNGKTKRRIGEAVRLVPCVVFTPDDLGLVKDSAGRRRQAVDDLGSQLAEAYAVLKLEYEKALRNRNAALKDGVSGPHFEVLTEVLVNRGVRLVSHRRRLLKRVVTHLQEIHEAISGGPGLEVSFVPSWQRDGVSSSDDHEAFIEHLRLKEDEERRRAVTLTGPHRDDIIFTLDGKDARGFGSQGQQRTIALAWKLAEVRVVTEVSGQKPVLILDDVMSELDVDRRRALTEYVGVAAQTFVTTTTTDYFEPDLIASAKVVRLT